MAAQTIIEPVGAGTVTLEVIGQWDDSGSELVDTGTFYRATAVPVQGWVFDHFEIVEDYYYNDGEIKTDELVYTLTSNPAEGQKGGSVLVDSYWDASTWFGPWMERRTLKSVKAVFTKQQPVHTGLILRSTSTGIILRRASTGVILRDA